MADRNPNDPPPPRFTPQNQTTHERLSSNTVGLVALSDFRKRRAEVLEQQEREAREALASGRSSHNATPDRSRTGTPNNANASDSGEGTAARPAKKKLKKKSKITNLSFGGDDEDDEEDSGPLLRKGAAKKEKKKSTGGEGMEEDADGDGDSTTKPARLVANKSVGIVPKAVTKSALRREAAERETLRREFLAIQKAVKATDVAIPFVFHDGTDVHGGMVRVKKGDHIWVFLDKSRKVGADLQVGDKKWARIGVDDLMLVRGSMIIPHHFEFYFFLMNKTLGPGDRLLFDWSAEATPTTVTDETPSDEDEDEAEDRPTAPPRGGLTTAAALKAAAARALPDIATLEGANDDPAFTKVVDRRWYERHKHIYPASTWQEFDPEKDYRSEVRKDMGGNTFFYSR